MPAFDPDPLPLPDREHSTGRVPVRQEQRGVVEHSKMRDTDLDALLGAVLSPFKRIVLAVSGGSDSMALMVLVARWIASGQAPGGLSVDVATVDHGLRSASGQEAEWVAVRAQALGFTHTTLVWGGDKPGTGIQERAREARYALLAAHAGRVSGADQGAPVAVVTAHTADDQAETLLMRLGRGSGLDGLAGMAPSRPLLPDGSVRLLRPLLGLSKAQLAGMLKAAGGTWIDDPSNERTDFERVRIRSAEEHLAALGLSNDKLSLSASRLQRARDALEHLTATKLASLVDVHGGAYASLDRAEWRKEPTELRVRLLARLLAAFGGDAKPAQLSQVEALEAVLAGDKAIAQTLGGCIVSQGLTTLRLYREPGRSKLPALLLAPGDEVLWDWRFRIKYGVEDASETEEDTLGAVSVRPLGLAAYATLRGELAPKDRLPARAADGLPAIWSGDRLIAVPSLRGWLQSDSRFSAVFLGLGEA
jgi:tRNA(Ile)-lysidine synthase